MRCLLFLIILPFALISGNKDSLAKTHYKVRFTFQEKIASAQFDLKSSNGNISTFKTYSEGNYDHFQGKINTDYTFNPEFKIDFEMPFWLKINCGINYTSLKFKYTSENIHHAEYTTYDPHSSPSNPIVTGSVIKDSIVGYNVIETQLGGIGTFIGLGFSKQYCRFNFDVDYSFLFTKLIDASTIRKIYDNNDVIQNTDGYIPMSDYLHQSGFRLFTNSISTSISYRFYKRMSLKVGYQYSKLLDIEDNTYNHYSSLKNIKCQSFIVGLVFNAI
jgi:hypothetical protein